MSAKVTTTFTFSSTDIASDTLSFSVSEVLSLTGSGGIERLNLAAATGSGSSYTIYQENSFPASTPTYLYIKNITGSGFSASAGGPSTASVVHLMQTGSGHNTNNQPQHPLARITMGNFAYIPMNPTSSYQIWQGNMLGAEGNIAADTIVEFGIFN
jgi:hypothetical protein